MGDLSLTDKEVAELENVRKMEMAMQILMDISRCHHGSWEGWRCEDCPDGVSIGNPHIRPGDPVGYDFSGRPYIVPEDPKLRFDPNNWITKG